MERLYPAPTGESTEDVYAEIGDRSGPWLAIGMVHSADGAATIDGVSGGLGAEGDRAAFRGLRAACDVILVGAGTVRAEGYGPPRMRPHDIARRTARGQRDRPAIAVVSASLDLHGAERLLDEDPDWRPIVVTTQDSDGERRDALHRRGAEVVIAGRHRVDLTAAVEVLRGRGMTRVLSEGGPHLNGGLLAADLVDELFVTVAPTVVGGGPPIRIVAGDLEEPVGLVLEGVRMHGSEVFLHYRVDR